MFNHPDLNFDVLSVIHVPTLVIAGSNDVIKEKHTKAIAGAINEARLEIIPEGGHFVLFEKPDYTNQLMMDFFKKVRSK
jgi:pimeloyl-ACP methyl ester carboxylesterase